FCSLLAPSDAILFQEGVSVKLRLPQVDLVIGKEGGNFIADATRREIEIKNPMRRSSGSFQLRKSGELRHF
ncbi:hypothetical protein, partial [Escherichia coli]|uniref:hypothetical protein n=1 Tax=Escherichia coli TaxID=562 RepID=UPI001BDB9ECF